MSFTEDTTLSMIRIWNYNKSRIHSYRGVRGVRISLNGVVIFEGEVRGNFLNTHPRCMLFNLKLSISRRVQQLCCSGRIIMFSLF